jgi:hypothetical protein
MPTHTPAEQLKNASQNPALGLPQNPGQAFGGSAPGLEQALASGQIPPGLLAVLMGLLQGGQPVGAPQAGPNPLAGIPAQQAAAGQATPGQISQINPAVRQNINPTLQGLAGPTV